MNVELSRRLRWSTASRALLAALMNVLVLGGVELYCLVAAPGYAAEFAVITVIALWWYERRCARSWTEVAATTGAADRVEARLERLCAQGDLALPSVQIVATAAPVSELRQWPGRPPRLRMGEQLVAALDDGELDAVIAHELGHLANRDAVLMTIIALPASVFWSVDRALRKRFGNWSAVFWITYMVPAAVLQWSARWVSRDRELAADRYSALLTGRPMALAAALRTLTDRDRAPLRDLRAVSAGVFNLLPVEPGGLWGSTHPSLARRLSALDGLERDRGGLVLTPDARPGGSSTSPPSR